MKKKPKENFDTIMKKTIEPTLEKAEIKNLLELEKLALSHLKTIQGDIAKIQINCEHDYEEISLTSLQCVKCLSKKFKSDWANK